MKAPAVASGFAGKGATAKSPPRPAERTVPLEPSAYRSTWKRTPKTAEMVGLRFIGIDELRRAKSFAMGEAWRLHKHEGDVLLRIDAYNDALACFIVARGTCQPTNVEAAFFHAAEDNVPLMLRPEAVRYLYDAIDQFAIECSPIRLEATSDELGELASLLTPNVIDKLALAERVRVKKLLRYVLEELRAVSPVPVDGNDPIDLPPSLPE